MFVYSLLDLIADRREIVEINAFTCSLLEVCHPILLGPSPSALRNPLIAQGSHTLDIFCKPGTPKTRQQYAADDPENPIGEHWIGIKGLESHNKDLDGFGIHGTVEPDSIGRQESMGCVRMLPDDVKLVYEILTEPSSTIEITGSNRIAVQPEE